MDSSQVKKIRKSFDISQQDFANLLEVAIRTVSRWENKEVDPSQIDTRRLKRFKRFASFIPMFGTPEDALFWASLPLPEFGQLRPRDLLIGTDYAASLIFKHLDEKLGKS